MLCHQALKKYTGRCSGTALLWLTVVCGTVMFGVGYHYPYVFPVRPLLSTDFVMNAGDIYPKASGVRADRVMYEKLAELKSLRTKYGSNYKTLPGFTLSYYLNDDMPVISSDWLQNWEINGKYQEVYDELVKNASPCSWNATRWTPSAPMATNAQATPFPSGSATAGSRSGKRSISSCSRSPTGNEPHGHGRCHYVARVLSSPVQG